MSAPYLGRGLTSLNWPHLLVSRTSTGFNTGMSEWREEGEVHITGWTPLRDATSSRTWHTLPSWLHRAASCSALAPCHRHGGIVTANENSLGSGSSLDLGGSVSLLLLVGVSVNIPRSRDALNPPALPEDGNRKIGWTT